MENTEQNVIQGTLYQPVYIKQHPYIGDDGIYMPVHEYVPEDMMSGYRMVMSKEMFIEAYNKWIKEE